MVRLATRTFQKGCICDSGNIRLDQYPQPLRSQNLLARVKCGGPERSGTAGRVPWLSRRINPYRVGFLQYENFMHRLSRPGRGTFPFPATLSSAGICCNKDPGSSSS